ncbi:hypothetical protein PR048_018621 [Dryococelus australis]|uniref:Uncharacterized protein n=1 Tax=Dryococelus australis TaxID=614101 RepID=A0ABQ9HCV2_9NEOP|nr:hypothetical protein PR048_018621 [Dryococelus australis]
MDCHSNTFSFLYDVRKLQEWDGDEFKAKCMQLAKVLTDGEKCDIDSRNFIKNCSSYHPCYPKEILQRIRSCEFKRSVPCARTTAVTQSSSESLVDVSSREWIAATFQGPKPALAIKALLVSTHHLEGRDHLLWREVHSIVTGEVLEAHVAEASCQSCLLHPSLLR